MPTLTPEGVAVLLVYGAEIKVARGPRFPGDPGQPGIRVTAGYADGTVLLEAVGFPHLGESVPAIQEADQACVDAGLDVSFAPRGRSRYPARIVSRKVSA
jgi:hypothetical protein